MFSLNIPSMARTRTKPRKKVDLGEDIVRGKAHKVDRERGVILGVKILGLDSVNGRRYTLEAIRAAQPMYEGIGVYVNHPTKPNDPRGVRERFGRLVNVRVEADGLYGDLEFLKSHPDANLIAEAAERMPEQFGLSHNAKGEGEDDSSGLFVVHEIVNARSVDVVTEPATTEGLFEQVNMKHTIKSLLESSWKKYAKRCTKRPRLTAYMKRLIEEDAYDVMDKQEEGEAPKEHEEALKEGFRASVSHIVADCLDGNEDPKECVKKISELLKAHDKLSGGDDEAEDDMEEEEPEAKDKEKESGKEAEEKGEKETEEQRRLRELEAKDNARDLCEEMGVTCDKVLLEALMHLPTEKARKRFLEREKAKSKTTAGPRSGVGGSGKTQDTLEGIGTPEAAMQMLLN